MNEKEVVDNIKLQLSFRKAKPLFIVENGSRAWGLDSKDSDYDIRIVYAYESDDYLSLSEPKDTFQLNVDKDFNAVTGDDVIYDIVGFDIKKFLKLLIKSNPTVLEWCTSPIVYFDSGFLKNKQLRMLVDNPNKRALYYHYSSLCRNNYMKYIRRENHITTKRYLCAIRGLVNATIASGDLLSSAPTLEIPSDFSEAVHALNFSDELKDEILDLIQVKRKGKEKETIKRHPILDDLMETFLINTQPVHSRASFFMPQRGLVADKIFKEEIIT